MKRIISFEKKIEFPSMIGEITSISLEHKLNFIDESNIEGNFVVNGTYKLTEASRIEENFYYELPAEIILTEKLDLSKSQIEINDFYYEIESDYTLICYIEVKVEGVEEIDIVEENNIDIQEISPEEDAVETLNDIVLKVEDVVVQDESYSVRECDGDIPKQQTEEEREQELDMQEEIKNTNINSIFESMNDSEETYSTYSVYILREEETITSLVSKYKTTKEELENYNDLSNLSIGSKIIIPLHEE